MFRQMTIAGAAGALLLFGALGVAAAESHGAAVKAVAGSSASTGDAHGDAVSMVAGVHGLIAKADAKADAAARKETRATSTTTDTDESEAKDVEAADADEAAEAAEAATDTDKATTADRDAHGDAVSKQAKSDCTMAHTTGDKENNHGGCVSAAAKSGD